MKILHLLDSLDGGDSTGQLQLLGPALTTSGKVHVCCLGCDTPWSAPLRQAGIGVNAFGWTRWFDPSALWNLRRLLRASDPDVIHVWHLPALRTLAVVAPGLLSRRGHECGVARREQACLVGSSINRRCALPGLH